MILKKIEIEKGFVQIPNEVLCRPDLSLPAKGLLCYMLSCAEGWKFSIKGISTATGASEHLVGKYLTELENLGYHKKEAIRDQGKITEWKYYIADYPAFINDEAPKEKPAPKKNLFDQCLEVIESDFRDADVKNKLAEYLRLRIKRGPLNRQSWKTTINHIRNLTNDKEEALEIIQRSIDGNWMSFFPAPKHIKRNQYIDDIVTLPKDQKVADQTAQYQEEMAMIPKCDRISFEEWLDKREGV